MSCIHNLKELNELNRDLVFGDYIYFSTKKGIIKYIIQDAYLNIPVGDNSRIFDVLNMNEGERHKLAEKYYGYKINDDAAWPEYRNKDYKAAKRLIKAIYILLGEKDVVEDPIISRFEILDIR